MTYPKDGVHCKDRQGVEDCPHSLSHDKLWREGRDWAKYLLTAPSDQNQQERYCVQGQGTHHHHRHLLPGVKQRTLVYDVHGVCVELESSGRGGTNGWREGEEVRICVDTLLVLSVIQLEDGWLLRILCLWWIPSNTLKVISLIWL